MMFYFRVHHIQIFSILLSEYVIDVSLPSLSYVYFSLLPVFIFSVQFPSLSYLYVVTFPFPSVSVCRFPLSSYEYSVIQWKSPRNPLYWLIVAVQLVHYFSDWEVTLGNQWFWMTWIHLEPIFWMWLRPNHWNW